MNPAFSILCFTTLSGAAQGLVVLIALATLSGVELHAEFVLQVLGLTVAMLLAGLASSFLHLGHKIRAWRAVLMWRTSWMSREVIVLPAFIVLVAVWWGGIFLGLTGFWLKALPVLVILGAIVLWVSTAMIYACLRFIQEWAHPLTVINFTLLGLALGMVLACALAAIAGEAALLRWGGLASLAVTLLAWGARLLSLRRNASLQHASNLQSATGIKSAHLVQKSMGMSAGSFNTREFFHGASLLAMKNVKVGFQCLAFALPAACMVWGLLGSSALPWVLALVAQAPGMLAERWFFFAQAKHPQNLYYQTVS